MLIEGENSDMPKSLIKLTTKSLATSTYKSLVAQVSKELSDLDLFVKRRATQGYWNIGKYIDEHLLANEKRAEYGATVLGRLAKDVNRDETSLSRSLQFYRTYPIPAVPQELSWEHYRSLITIKDEKERKKIENKVVRNDWTSTKLQEYLKSRREPVKTDQPVVKPASPAGRLKFTRGKIHTFQIVKACKPLEDASPLVLDFGFRLQHVLPPGAPRLKEADIVDIVFKDGQPMGIQKSKASKDELFTYQAQVDKIIDGDTLLISLAFNGVFAISQKLRLRGIDCPEMDTEAGKKAKRFVESRLKGLDSIIVKTYKDRSDKFDRYLADIFYGPQETFLNQELLDEGLAQIYKT